MDTYKIIHAMKIKGKSLVVLDHAPSVSDLCKQKIAIGSEVFSYYLTHGDNSIIIDTDTDLNEKTIRFM